MYHRFSFFSSLLFQSKMKKKEKTGKNQTEKKQRREKEGKKVKTVNSPQDLDCLHSSSSNKHLFPL